MFLKKNISYFFILPIYYLIRKSFFFGLIHKFLIKKFYYKNLKFNLNIEGLSISCFTSFFFKTYEYNDRVLVEKYINHKNKCIIIGGGIGFIPSLSYQKSMNRILVFEINEKIIKNLNKNLTQNNCDFALYNKNLTLLNENKVSSYFVGEIFSSTSKYVKTKKIKQIENINKKDVINFDQYNTLLIDGEGIEEYFINNLDKLHHIKYLIFELHYNIFEEKKINLIFQKLKEFNFIQVDKCFNSFYFVKNLNC